MSNLNIEGLKAAVLAAFEEGGETIQERLEHIIDSSYNRTDDAGGGGGLSLGETSGTAYRGDRGKTAYDHSQATHANASATVNSTDAQLRDTDTHTDGSTNKVFTAIEKTKLNHISVTQSVDLDQMESRLNDLDAAVVLKGTFAPSGGVFPGGGVAQAGWSYIADDNGTINGVEIKLGDRLIAILDNASTATFAANWFKADYTDTVLSVNGLTGAVSLDASNINPTAGRQYVDAAEKTVLSNTSNTNSGDNATNSQYSGLAASKQDLLTNGFGLTGTTTKAVALTNSTAFVTAETTIAAATYADITGATLSLAAGTWMIFAQVNIRFVNAIVQAFVAITDGAGTVLSEIAASRPASGTASLNSPFSCNLFAIVTPVGVTTYKIRGARGLTTHTGSWTAMDGAGTNTANHASNNSDKGTGIFAIRIA